MAASVVILCAVATNVVGVGAASAATSDWVLTQGSGALAARSGAAMAYDTATGQTLMFGGTTTTPYVAGKVLADTWEWDGAAWHQLHPATNPPALTGAALAYDPDTREVVLFGGSTGDIFSSPSAQTWVWNGVTWRQVHPATSPPAVAGATMAYDAETSQLVLTGGSGVTNGAFVSDKQTWVWDGTNWVQQVHAADLPTDDVTMAYDAAHGELLLVQEGIGSNSAAWEWSGDTWFPLSVDPASAPPSRDGAVLVYSPAAQSLIFEGGETVVDNFVGDVWSWNGNSWSQDTDGSPYPMASSAAAVDSAGQLVMFGGLEGYITRVIAVADTWVYRPARLAPTAAVPSRVAGADREGTAIAVSKAAYGGAGSASAVVLARADQFADALTGGPLAAYEKGPLLLTSSSSLDSGVATELSRVLTAGGKVYLLGGTSALSSGVEAAVQNLGFTPVRLSGADRYATALAVADAMGDPSTVFEASGIDFADVLSAVPAAIVSGGAIVLTDGAQQTPSTAAFLTAHAKTRYAIGGPAAAADPSATAIAGTDRYGTSVQVAAAFFPDATGVGVASGVAFPDALAAGPVLGEAKEPMLLVPASGGLGVSSSSYLALHDGALATVTAYGGLSAVSDAVLSAVTAALSAP